MDWPWKWLESYNDCTFSTWKDKLLFNLLFWIPNSFCTFHDYARGGTPSLPPLTARHWLSIIQIFEQLSFSEKHSCPETFHCDEIFFIFQDFWATCGLPWKTECARNSLYWIYTYLIIQNFEQLAHALKNRVCPKIFHCIEIFLPFSIFEELALALKTEFFLKFFAVFNVLFTFRMFEQLLLTLKNRVCPEFTVLNVFFVLQNFEQLALALKSRVSPENFHCIEITIFEELAVAPKTEFFLKYFTVLNIVFTFRIFEQLMATCACPEKESVPWIHCIEHIFFIIQNFEQPALALKNRNWPEIFHCIEIFLSFKIFEQPELALKTKFFLNFSSRGDGRPPASYATGYFDVLLQALRPFCVF